MDLETQFKIKQNPYIKRYLRENSYWYKNLTRNPASIKNLEEEIKNVYRLTPKDKLEDFSKKIEMIQNFMDILK